MNRKELQQALKPFKEAGLVTIKLTSTTDKLQEEFDQVGSCPIGFTPIPEPEIDLTENQGTEAEHFDNMTGEFMAFPHCPIYPQCPLTCECEACFVPNKDSESLGEKIMRAFKEDKLPDIETIERLYDDNDQLFTTEGLSELLKECAWISLDMNLQESKYPSLISEPWIMASLAKIDRASYRRLFAEPSEFLPEEMTSGARRGIEMYQRMAEFVGTEGISSVCFYHAIRASIQDLQEAIECPSVRWREFDCRGEKFNFMDFDDQLLMLEGDLLMAERYASATASHFCSLAQLRSPKYSLVRLGEDEEELPTTFRQLKDFASRAKYAMLRHESHDWEQKGDAWASYGIGVDRKDEPDIIELALILEWDGDPKFGSWGECEVFRLVHPDPARRPWLLEASS